jgi:8-oxo-dGTP pyrophosphatase MutT (NUDIX family)
MSDHKHHIPTILSAVSLFIDSHDKEDYEGVIIIARQKNDLYQLFAGGTAYDPDCVEDWAGAPFIIDSMLKDVAEWGEPEQPQLQVISGDNGQASSEPSVSNTGAGSATTEALLPKTLDGIAETGKPEKPQLQATNGNNGQVQSDPSVPDISSYPAMMQEVYHKSLYPGTRLNDEGELIDDPGVYHPRLNDKGEWVLIKHPTSPMPMSAFDDATKCAVMLANGQAPASLNGIAFQPWQTAPKTLSEWVHVEGQVKLDEPPLVPKKGKKLSAGVVVEEPDGRFWLVAPTNAFGGYKATFPKGRLEPGMNAQATAIKETLEEAGLQVEITGLIGDFERTTTITRYYTARRVGGLPTQMGWESQAVMLVPKLKLLKVLNHANDHKVIEKLDELSGKG